MAEIGEVMASVCPDCGTPAAGAYCSACGERIEPHLPSVRHYIAELVGDLIALDSKIVRTIPALLFRPGFLTTEFIAGRRQRYLTPLRLYTLVGIVMFFLLGNTLHNVVVNPQKSDVVHFDLTGNNSGNASGHQLGEAIARIFSSLAPYAILLGSTPFFALFLKLLYRNRPILYGRHLIFSFHLFAFSFLSLMPGMIVNWGYGLIAGAAVFLIYLCFALRRVYDDSGWRLILRFLLASGAYITVVSAGMIFSLALAFGYGYVTGQIPGSMQGGISF